MHTGKAHADDCKSGRNTLLRLLQDEVCIMRAGRVSAPEEYGYCAVLPRLCLRHKLAASHAGKLVAHGCARKQT